jgi:hypothetical protein
VSVSRRDEEMLAAFLKYVARWEPSQTLFFCVGAPENSALKQFIFTAGVSVDHELPPVHPE